MKIVLSHTMGYCGGVSRALKMASDAIEQARRENRPVYSLGNLIHNRQVCAGFEQQGLVEISSFEGYEPGLVVIRAHGITDQMRADFIASGFELVDATCPVVKHNLKLIAQYAPDHTILIIGHRGHPEAIAMMGVLVDGKPIKAYLITKIEEIPACETGVQYAVFVQTTFDDCLWKEIQAALAAWKAPMVFANNICPTSVGRRSSLAELAQSCDGILVIGGRDSANTRALYTLALELGRKAWHIEDETEIIDDIRRCAILGITAGASTPPELVQRVVQTLQQE